MRGTPIALIGMDEARQAMRMHMRNAGADFSSNEFHEFDTLADAQREVENLGSTVIMVVYFDDFSAEVLNQLSLLRARNAGPIVALTDNSGALRDLRENGYTFILSYQGLTTPTLSGILQASWDHFQMSQTHANLRQAVVEAENRFRDVASQFTDWIWEIDTELNVKFSTARRQSSDRPKIMDYFLHDEQMRVEEDFNKLVLDPQPFNNREYWSIDHSGSRVCWSLSGVPVFDSSDKLVGFRGMGKDISSQKASVDQLYYLSNHDQLTGLFNRSRFMGDLTRLINQLKRQQRTGVLLVIDIDRFSYVNETYGHELADKLLVHVGKTLRDHLRFGEVAARVGGDEFALVMTDVSANDVEQRAKQIINALKGSPMESEHGTISYGASIGAAWLPEHGETADKALVNADAALLNAKAKGRNRFEVFDPAAERMHSAQHHLGGLNMLNACLEKPKERVLLHYQPIVSLSNTKDEFYELLVRLVDEQGDLVFPIDFIPAAENYGVIGEIDRIVCERALELLAKWQKSGRKVRLAVNVSARTFDDDVFIESIKTALENTKIIPGSLVMEITETVVLRDLEYAQKFIAEMRALGVAFALDDCGVGYSSLNYIRGLELDYIKIDGSFIRDLHNNKADETFVRALQDIAKQMQILTVAEMVEHEETVEKLKNIGIDFAQGFHFAKPDEEIPDKKKLN